MKRSELVPLKAKKAPQLFLLICIICENCGEKTFYFPDNFVWGAATSSYQSEGNNENCDWYVWEKMRPLFIEEPSGKAANAYELYETDAELAGNLNLTHFRFSIEWSRVEPQRDVWDEGEIDHYRNFIKLLLRNNVKPILTLHHFTNPLWVLNPENPFSDLDGWAGEETIDEFVEYAKRLAEEYGRDVDLYLTINEPVIIALGYLLGIFPPGEVNFSPEGIFKRVYPVMKNLITAHSKAYDAIKEIDVWDSDGDGISAEVGLPETIAFYEPADPLSEGDILATLRMEIFYDFNLYDSLTGRGFDENLDGEPDDKREEWKNKVDFIGMNYYNHWYVKDLPLMPYPVSALPCFSMRGFDLSLFLRDCPHPGGERSDLGYEIYPEGIYHLIKKLYQRYRIPILITENGIATRDEVKKARIIVEHLRWVKKALEDGVDVRGYIYWSFTDNWEWGTFEPRFGLYSVDYENNFMRKLTYAGEIYSKIAKCNCLPPHILEEK